jgi:peptide/nickel transport system permease protein
MLDIIPARMSPLLQNLLILAALAPPCIAAWMFACSVRWERAIRRFRSNKIGMISFFVIVAYLLTGVADLVLVSQKHANGRNMTLLDAIFQKVPLENSYSAPMAANDLEGDALHGFHLLGTDALGKDVFLQTLKACRTALLIGGLTSAVYIPIGILLGIMAGYFKKRVDDIIYYIYSTMASVPNILLLVAILLVLGKGIPQMAFALGITGWIGLCRLLRGETLRQSERQYSEAARALGQSHWRIIIRHILPNVMHLVFINFVLGFSSIVLAEAMLSYLGVGAPIGTASWGAMIDSARMELSREPAVWWNIVSATCALFVLVLALNLLGDALRRAFDPKAV